MTDPKQLSGMSLKTQSSFLSLQVITACCHAVLNTQFTPLTPKPVWFDDLNAKLDYAKTVAGEWINTLSVEVTSKVPSSVIDYSTTYDALTQQIMKIADANPDAVGKDNKYVIQVNELIDALLGSVGTIIADVDSTANNLEAWGEKLQKAHDDLSSGAANIQKAEVDLQVDIDKMNAAIKTLNDAIQAENKAIAYSAMAVGIGLFVLVVGIALIPETGGVGIAVATTGALAIVGGAITWGIMQDKINKQYGEIDKDTKELKDDQRQLVALQGLAGASDLATSSLADASKALSDFRTSWGVFENELKGVQSKLNQGKDSLVMVVKGAFTQAAAEEWADAEQLAQDLIDSKVTIESKTLTPDTKAA